MWLFAIALGAWISGVGFGLIKPSVDDEEILVVRRRR
jgi:hypothetical protein